jgi:hypothetical protein
MGDDERRSTISIADFSFAALSTSPPCDCVRFALEVGEKYAVISALPLPARGVENSGDGRLSLLVFLGVRWSSGSFGRRVVGAGCEDAKKSSGIRAFGTVLRIM